MEVMNYIEEQKTELEILQNIYLNEIEITKASPPFSFSITCRPFLDAWSIFDEVLESTAIKLHLDIPVNYPEESPVFKLNSDLFILNDDRKIHFEKVVRQVISSFKGNPMLFDIVETIRFHILDSCVDDKYKDIRASEEESKEELNEKVKYDSYTPVTKANFLIWKKAFDASRVDAIKDKDGNAKLSGKEYFLQRPLEEVELEDGEDGLDFEE